MNDLHQAKSLGEMLGDIADAIEGAAREIVKKWREATGAEPEPQPVPIPVERDRDRRQRFQADSADLAQVSFSFRGDN